MHRHPSPQHWRGTTGKTKNPVPAYRKPLFGRTKSWSLVRGGMLCPFCPFTRLPTVETHFAELGDYFLMLGFMKSYWTPLRPPGSTSNPVKAFKSANHLPCSTSIISMAGNTFCSPPKPGYKERLTVMIHRGSENSQLLWDFFFPFSNMP